MHLNSYKKYDVSMWIIDDNKEMIYHWDFLKKKQEQLVWVIYFLSTRMQETI